MLQYHFNWKMLSAMAGVTWWNFYFRLFPGAIRSPQIIEFLSHLLRHIPGKLLIVWDGLPGHRSRMVWDFVRQQRGRLWLEVLACLCPGTQPCGVSVVALEAARVTQLLPHNSRAAEPSRAPGASSYAQAAYPGDRLLAAGRPVSDVTVFMQIFNDYRS